MNLLRWLRERSLPPTIRQRRRYLEALRTRQPFAAVHSSGAPEVRAVHEACGLRHLSWEYCPVQPGNPSGGRWEREVFEIDPDPSGFRRYEAGDVRWAIPIEEAYARGLLVRGPDFRPRTHQHAGLVSRYNHDEHDCALHS